MNEITIPVKTIKILMLKEVESHFTSARTNIYSDVQRRMLYLGYYDVKMVLEHAESIDDLQDALDMLDYRMSVQEWINSL